MAKLTRRLHDRRDAMRRFARRGVARAVLEKAHDAQYMAGHPIAKELARENSTKRIERWATERNPMSSTGKTCFQVNGARPDVPEGFCARCWELLDQGEHGLGLCPLRPVSELPVEVGP